VKKWLEIALKIAFMIADKTNSVSNAPRAVGMRR